MATKFYSYQDIKDRADCTTIAAALGLQLKNGRCNAEWRSGSNSTSVAINRDGWHDFSTEESGSVIDLVALMRFSGDRQMAQEWLGDYLHLTPKIDKLAPNPTRERSRYETLIEDGYREVNRYEYTDIDGDVIHRVLRMEHTDKPGAKEFIQQAADGRWTIKHINTVLFNLPGIDASPWVIVVEGEKDAVTLTDLELPATTNAGGANKWKPEYSETLRGKDVCILPDNDEPGRRHANLIAGQLVGIAKEIRIITLSSIPKGDVTDWITQEKGSARKLLKLIKQNPPIDTRVIDEQFQIARAKEANKNPFRNYSLTEAIVAGKPKTTQEPRHINAMIEDCYTRFLGFPRRVGDELFDQDKDTGDIVYIRKSQELFSWITRKSKQILEWGRGINMTSKDEYFAGLRATAPKYEAISSVPDWPVRTDVYYQHSDLCAPSPDHKYLNGLADFFNPISPEYRVLVKAFIAAPIYFEPLLQRPMWIIDSESPGAGKSTLATRVALLYGHPAVEVKTNDFARDMQEVTKRLVSSEGRQSRMLLVDNVIGTFASEELAAMVTMPHITGRPPYGRGEETRPNNLTYVITANNASIDNDLAIRSFFVRLATLNDYRESWARDLSVYIERNRYRIFADIIDILNNPPDIQDGPYTRFPEFETLVLRAMCDDTEQYQAVMTTLAESRASANVEEEWGKQIEDTINYQLASILALTSDRWVWIRSQVVSEWIKEAIEHVRSPVQMLRNLARSGHCTRANPNIASYPHHGPGRRRGIMWQYGDPAHDAKPIIVGKVGSSIKIIGESQ